MKTYQLTKTRLKQLETLGIDAVANQINARKQRGWSFTDVSKEVYVQRKAEIVAEVKRDFELGGWQGVWRKWEIWL